MVRRPPETTMLIRGTLAGRPTVVVPRYTLRQLTIIIIIEGG